MQLGRRFTDEEVRFIPRWFSVTFRDDQRVQRHKGGHRGKGTQRLELSLGIESAEFLLRRVALGRNRDASRKAHRWLCMISAGDERIGKSFGGGGALGGDLWGVYVRTAGGKRDRE